MPQPAQCGLVEVFGRSLAQRENSAGKQSRESATILTSMLRRWRGSWLPFPLQSVNEPQMKKYRSLWGMSTTNHNILYFNVKHRI
jgi:hypothetical protein